MDVLIFYSNKNWDEQREKQTDKKISWVRDNTKQEKIHNNNLIFIQPIWGLGFWFRLGLSKINTKQENNKKRNIKNTHTQNGYISCLFVHCSIVLLIKMNTYLIKCHRSG